MKITKELLLDNNWEQFEDPLMKNIPECYQYECYTYKVKNIHDKEVYIDIKHGLSNTVGREWCVHADNWLHEGIGCVDIETTEQFNKFMEILEIDYKL